MTIGDDTYKIQKRLKINEGIRMIPDTQKIIYANIETDI
jgi:hypothetical protein